MPPRIKWVTIFRRALISAIAIVLISLIFLMRMDCAIDLGTGDNLYTFMVGEIVVLEHRSVTNLSQDLRKMDLIKVRRPFIMTSYNILGSKSNSWNGKVVLGLDVFAKTILEEKSIRINDKKTMWNNIYESPDAEILVRRIGDIVGK